MKFNNNEIQLDWLSFTYFGNHTGDLIEDFFADFPELQKIQCLLEIKKGDIYNNSLFLDEYMQIFFDNSAETGKGVNVRISSHGLGRFFEYFNSPSVKDMFKLLSLRNCRPSRIDLAFDDKTKTYTPKYYQSKWQNGKIVSRMQKQASFTDLVTGGSTFYIGSRRKKQVRIYDKFKESDGEIDAIRYEIEMHANAAISFFNFLIDCDDSDQIFFGDLLTDIFKVVNPNYKDMQHKDRWPVNARWLNWLQKTTFSQSSFKIPQYRPDQIVKKIEKWVRKECFGVLAFFRKLYGDQWINNQLKTIDLPVKYKLLVNDLHRSWIHWEYQDDDYYNRIFLL